MNLFGQLHFVNPELFLLLILVPLLYVWYYYKRNSYFPRIKLPSFESIAGMKSLRGRLRILIPLLRALSMIAMIIALARPQAVLKEEEIKAEGIDIVLVMDLSSSMLAQDFKPDRLWASKKVAGDFVKGRKYDRIGLAAFAGEAYTQCPLTTDHRVLLEFLNPQAGLQCGIMQDGTAIGMGLATAVNRLKESEAESKVVILLTDGVNNAGYVKPNTAAEIAKEFNIKVYTIGVGTTGEAYAPVSRRSDGRFMFGMSRVQIDEKLLRQIANETGGKYYRATTEQALQQVYAQIDKLEKTEIEVSVLKRYQEKFHPFALAGIIFLLIEALLKYLFLRAIP